MCAGLRGSMNVRDVESDGDTAVHARVRRCTRVHAHFLHASFSFSVHGCIL